MSSTNSNSNDITYSPAEILAIYNNLKLNNNIKIDPNAANSNSSRASSLKDPVSMDLFSKEEIQSAQEKIKLKQQREPNESPGIGKDLPLSSSMTTSTSTSTIGNSTFTTPESTKWFYMDMNSIQQGPFDSSLMQQWYLQNLLSHSLTVRRDIDTNWITISDLWKKCNALPNYNIQNAPFNQSLPKILISNPNNNIPKLASFNSSSSMFANQFFNNNNNNSSAINSTNPTTTNSPDPNIAHMSTIANNGSSVTTPIDSATPLNSRSNSSYNNLLMNPMMNLSGVNSMNNMNNMNNMSNMSNMSNMNNLNLNNLNGLNNMNSFDNSLNMNLNNMFMNDINSMSGINNLNVNNSLNMNMDMNNLNMNMNMGMMNNLNMLDQMSNISNFSTLTNMSNLNYGLDSMMDPLLMNNSLNNSMNHSMNTVMNGSINATIDPINNSLNNTSDNAANSFNSFSNIIDGLDKSNTLGNEQPIPSNEKTLKVNEEIKQEVKQQIKKPESVYKVKETIPEPVKTAEPKPAPAPVSEPVKTSVPPPVSKPTPVTKKQDSIPEAVRESLKHAFSLEEHMNELKIDTKKKQDQINRENAAAALAAAEAAAAQEQSDEEDDNVSDKEKISAPIIEEKKESVKQTSKPIKSVVAPWASVSKNVKPSKTFEQIQQEEKMKKQRELEQRRKMEEADRLLASKLAFEESIIPTINVNNKKKIVSIAELTSSNSANNLPTNSTWAVNNNNLTSIPIKSFDEIKKEELENARLNEQLQQAERNQRTIAEAIANKQKTSNSSISNENQSSNATNSWTVVSKKDAKPKVSTPVTSTIPMTTPVVKTTQVRYSAPSVPSISSTSKNYPPMAIEFLTWCRSQLSGLYPTVNKEDVLQIMMQLPSGSESNEIIADTIYSNSSTMDGRRFSTEFMKKRNRIEDTIKRREWAFDWFDAIEGTKNLPINNSTTSSSSNTENDDWDSAFTVVRKKGRKGN